MKRSSDIPSDDVMVRLMEERAQLMVNLLKVQTEMLKHDNINSTPATIVGNLTMLLATAITLAMEEENVGE